MKMYANSNNLEKQHLKNDRSLYWKLICCTFKMSGFPVKDNLGRHVILSS